MKKKQTIQLNVKVDIDTAELIKKLANQNSVAVAEQLRTFIDKGLSVEGYKQDIDFIADIIRQEFHAVYHVGDIERVMQKQTDRIAKMTMKTGKLSSAEF